MEVGGEEAFVDIAAPEAIMAGMERVRRRRRGVVSGSRRGLKGVMGGNERWA